MADSISPRAQAILDAIEREVGARGEPVRDLAAALPPTPGARLDLPEPPSSRLGRSAPAPMHAEERNRPFADERIRRLVDDVVTQAEAARLRLAALSEAIEDVAGRLGTPLAASPFNVEAEDDRAPESPGGEVVEMPRRAPAGSARMPPVPVPASSHRPVTDTGPQVPVGRPEQVLDALLARRSAGPPKRPEQHAEGPYAQDEASWMAQALQVDGGHGASTAPEAPELHAAPLAPTPPPPRATAPPGAGTEPEQAAAPERIEEPAPAHTPIPSPPVIYTTTDTMSSAPAPRTSAAPPEPPRPG